MMLSLGQLNERMSKLKDWTLEGDSIVKDYVFVDAPTAMHFVNSLAEIAEAREHHPLILIDENNVKISLTTKSAGGLTEKDFDMAQEIDAVKI